MTCRERLKIEHTKMFDEEGCPLACPSDYGYADDPVECLCSPYDEITCEQCWDREAPAMTQLDRIKSFTLDEMAEFLLEHASCQCCSRKNFDACHDVGDCKTHVIEYLESEV